MHSMPRIGGALPLLAGALLLALAACGSSSSSSSGSSSSTSTSSSSNTTGPYTLTFIAGSGYSVNHGGQTLKVALIDNHTNAVVSTNTTTVSSTGNTTSAFSGLMAKDGVYDVAWYVDVDGSGTCNSAPTDHQWQAPITDPDGNGVNDGTDTTFISTSVENDITYTQAHDTNFTSVCVYFP